MNLGRTVLVVAAAVVLAAACDRSAPVQPGPVPSEQVVSLGPAGSVAALGKDDWPTYHRDNERSGVAPDFPAPHALSKAWTTRLDGAVYGQPLVVGDTVFAATEHDTVYALAADTGQIRWQTHVGEPMPGSQLPC